MSTSTTTIEAIPTIVKTESFREGRPLIVGPDVPQRPFPIALSGPVQRGFDRGGKDLGCPTANLPDESLPAMCDVTQTGVYYGYAQIYSPRGGPALHSDDAKVLPMVMSLGWNPFYMNKRMTAEVHILHEFQTDFYGYELKALVLGYIRPELNYTSREDLIEDINTDKRVALSSLARPSYEKFQSDKYFN